MMGGCGRQLEDHYRRQGSNAQDLAAKGKIGRDKMRDKVGHSGDKLGGKLRDKLRYKPRDNGEARK